MISCPVGQSLYHSVAYTHLIVVSDHLCDMSSYAEGFLVATPGVLFVLFAASEIFCYSLVIMEILQYTH